LVRDGDTGAFIHIVRRYRKMLFTIIHKIVRNRVEAEDIMQEVFIRVFKSLDTFREEAVFSTWLYRIAYNTTVSEIRKARGIVVPLDDKAGSTVYEEITDDADERMNREEQLCCLETVLSKLPANDAMLVSLYYMNNLPVEEVGKIAGISTSNVKVRLFRIRKYMNVEINKLLLR
jgi:RNA polymerase sigma-70 factor (ECF subfamily)